MEKTLSRVIVIVLAMMIEIAIVIVIDVQLVFGKKMSKFCQSQKWELEVCDEGNQNGTFFPVHPVVALIVELKED